MSSKNENVQRWRHNTKQRIIDAFDGHCCCCGYNQCNAALELHHLIPKEKEFSFGHIMANPKSWAKIVEELKKCILVCANCHREIHNLNKKIPDDAPKFNMDYSNYKKMIAEQKQNPCPICGKLKNAWQFVCSNICAGQLRGKVKWGDFDLYDLHVIKKLNNCEIAKICGCSDVAVIKRLKKLGIYKNNR